MVIFAPHLDTTFAALADPTRRAIVAMLAEKRSATVSELAEPFSMSLPAVLKHVGVLADAGLVTRVKTGRTVHCSLAPARLTAARAWLDHYARFWSARLDALDRYLEDDTCPTAPNSSSGGRTARRPTASSRRGRNPRR